MVLEKRLMMRIGSCELNNSNWVFIQPVSGVGSPQRLEESLLHQFITLLHPGSPSTYVPTDQRNDWKTNVRVKSCFLLFS